MEIIPKSRKKNGFSCPLHIYQIISWLITIFNFISALSIIIPQYNDDSFIIILILFLILFSIHTFLGLRVTYSDPTDPVIFIYHSSVDLSVLQKLEETHERYCSICISPVNMSSKHCMRCSRCSVGFDHHCKWVNNCIAQKNYRLFITFILFVEIYHFFLIYIQVSVLIFMMSLNDTDKENFLGHNVSFYYMSFSILCVSLCLCLIILIFVGYLILYHAYIGIKGISTYEHILMKTKKIIPDFQGAEKSVTQNGRNPIIPGSESFKLELSVRHEVSFLLKN